MSVSELLRWQFDGYAEFHRSRSNLLLHIIVVPLFLLANVALVAALMVGAWWLAVASVVLMVVSIALQGRGHGVEPTPPIPFSSASNALKRIFFEQWVTFPRFVLSGGWVRAMRDSSLSPSSRFSTG
jgi:uncharacterized membrane protein